MDAKAFSKLSLQRRYNLLKQEGEFVASRISGEHMVSLFTCQGLYVEVWKLTGLHQIRWIEVQSNEVVLEEYADQVDVTSHLQA